MKKTFGIMIAALAFFGCNRTPLNIHVDVPVASASDTETKTQTASVTSVRTKTATDTGTSTATLTDTASTTATTTTTDSSTKIALTGELVVDFSTVFSSSALFREKPGQKDVNFGTLIFTNNTNKKLEVREAVIKMIFSLDPWSNMPWTEVGASPDGPRLVFGHLVNCRLRSWPEIKVYAGLSGPGTPSAFDDIGPFEVERFTGANSLALNVVCDITEEEVDAELGIGLDLMDSDHVLAYDSEGNRAKVTFGQLNGNPPKVAAILQPSSGEAYFCPVNDSTISQGCCMPDGASFVRPSLSDLTHQPNAYTLVKGSNPLVYLYTADGKRYVFPSKDVITSWFTSFDGGQLGDLVNVCNTVNELSDAELASITIGGNVTIRPGSYIVKIASDPKLYVISKGKVLRWLSTPDLAEQLYPGTSAQRIRVIPDTFFVNYFIGLEVKDASDYDPAAEWAAADMEAEAAAK